MAVAGAVMAVGAMAVMGGMLAVGAIMAVMGTGFGTCRGIGTYHNRQTFLGPQLSSFERGNGGANHSSHTGNASLATFE